MNTISIPVEPEIQAAFEQASEDERRALAQLVGLFLKEGWGNKNLIQVMQEIGSRAEQRGLTPEILANLLAADEQA
ncbi:hypothetical protein [Almyronema epifaneia]|uniref:Uncharacterized protein n=1 Tax=Almyronema epifaneia S1 TaxID=2991925 RepID=A0ABW6IM83_9CYAN